MIDVVNPPIGVENLTGEVDLVGCIRLTFADGVLTAINFAQYDYAACVDQFGAHFYVRPVGERAQSPNWPKPEPKPK